MQNKMAQISSSNKRLAKNTIALYFRTAMVMFISLYISRVLLKTLGVEDYGIYNVVGSIVILFSFLNTSMSQAIQRFLNFCLGKEDVKNANRIFNLSLITQFSIVFILLVLCETLGIWLLNNYLNIPIERMYAAKWAYQMSVLTLCIHMMTTPYNAAVIAHERMSFFAYASILDSVLKLCIAFSLTWGHTDNLILYSTLLVMEAVIMLVVYISFCVCNFSTCKFYFYWNSEQYKQLMSFSGWTLCGSFTNILTQKGFTILLNIFYGVIANAAMGIAHQVIAAVTSFIGGFQTSFRPQIVKSYAQGNNAHLLKLVSVTSKISFFLAYVPALILIINTPLVLKIWLGNVPEFSVEFCRMILICCIIDATTGSYNCAITATGVIRNYQISVSISFLLDLIASAILMKLGVEPLYLLIPRILTRGFLNMIIGLYFMKKLLSFNVHKYLKEVICPISIFVLVMYSISVTTTVATDWTLLILSSLYTIIIGCVLFFFIVLGKDERNYVIMLLNRFKWK